MTWPRDGVPANPAGWLLTVGRRRAIDVYRRRSALDEKYAALAHDLREGGTTSGAPPAPTIRRSPATCCATPTRSTTTCSRWCSSPATRCCRPRRRVALTLRVVGGLTSDEIARAFLVPTATVQARITRAKKTLSAAQVPFEVPPPEERRERLGSVLSVVYVIFTEGSSATSGDAWIRTDLAHEGDPAGAGPGPADARRARGARPARAARADRGEVPRPHRRRRRARAAGRPGPTAVGPAAIRRGRAALAQAGGVGRGLGRLRRCRRRSPSATPSPRRSTRRTGTGSWCSTRRSGGWRRRPSSSSTGRSRSRWRRVRRAALAIVDELVARGRLRGLPPAAERAGRAAPAGRATRRRAPRARGRQSRSARTGASARSSPASWPTSTLRCRPGRSRADAYEWVRPTKPTRTTAAARASAISHEVCRTRRSRRRPATPRPRRS